MEVDRFQPPNKPAIESRHWSASPVIPVMSTFETLKAFFMGSRRRERGLKKVQKNRRLRLLVLKVTSSLWKLRGWGRLAGSEAVSQPGYFDSHGLGIT